MEKNYYFILFIIFLAVIAISIILFFIFYKKEKYVNLYTSNCKCGDNSGLSGILDCNGDCQVCDKLCNKNCENKRTKCENEMEYIYGEALYNNPVGSVMKSSCIQDWRKCKKKC
jgi:hypothetical protein